MAVLNSGLGGASGYGEQSFKTTGGYTGNLDDGSRLVDVSGVFGTGGMDVYGSRFTSFYINTNGLITFTSAQPSYTPAALTTLGQPSIAPFWTDIDISKGGDIYWDIDATTGKITITWLNVAPYTGTGTNSFQAVITNLGGGDFGVDYLYNSVGFTNGYAGQATVGISNGTTSQTLLEGSGNAAFLATYAGNDFDTNDPAGVYSMQFEAGQVFQGDGVVDGTAGNDLIDTSYAADPDGDRIDANDGTGYVGTTGQADYVLAGAGNDTVNSGLGRDIVYGGSGNDVVNAGTGNDSVYGDDGNDSLEGSSGNDSLYGGAGDDTLSGGTATTGTTYAPVYTEVTAALQSVAGTNGRPNFTVNTVSSDNQLSTGTSGTLTGFYLGNTDAVETHTHTASSQLAGGQILFNAINGNETLTIVIDGVTIDLNTAIASGMVTFSGNAVYAINASGQVIRIGSGATSTTNGTLTINVPYTTVSLTSGGTTTGSAAGLYYEYYANTNPLNVAAEAAGDDYLSGGLGNDSLLGYDGNDTLFGDDGNDTLDGGNGNDSLNGGIGDDSLLGLVGNDTLLGGDGRDSLYGGAGNDSLLGEAGNDTLLGGDGNDTLDGGTEADSLLGEAGNDSLLGGDANDSLYGGAGDDTLSGGAGADLIYGGNDNDSLFGGTENDTLYGDAGSDSLSGGAGLDQLFGGDGNDTLLGDDGNDTLSGDLGNDSLFGGLGNDQLYGGLGNDLVYGDAGNDTLHGDAGADTLYGGTGDDLFLVDGNANAYGDVIVGGENVGDNDVLDLTSWGWELTNIIYDPMNSENGTVEFLDGAGHVVGTMTFSNIEKVIPCFTPGVMITTDRGDVVVEDLRAGDLLLTRDHGLQPIRWIGSRKLGLGDLIAQPHLQPVKIGQGALGCGLPLRDTLVSPQHRMLIEGALPEMLFGEAEVLVAATHLTVLPGVVQILSSGVRYIHLLLEHHEIICANGAWTESFQPAKRMLDAMEDGLRAEITELFPELRLDHADYPAARLTLKAHEAKVLLAA